MPIDYSAAENFIWSAARLVDRHRYILLFADGPAQPVIDALPGYRSPDGGFGHALEPDLRSPGSQPAPTLHALEILNEAGAADSEMARDARAFIASIAAPDGGIPFVLPGFEKYPHAPWWSGLQPEPGSFLTLALAAVLHAGGVNSDDWLDRATSWSWRSIETTEQPGGYWLKYACAFLDAVPDAEQARAAIASLATRVGPAAVVPVGGVEGEALRPLDLSPRRGSRSRGLVSETQVEAHLDAVESGQQEDGGWMFDWLAWSPAQTTDWRGTVTIRALTWLRDNGRLSRQRTTMKTPSRDGLGYPSIVEVMAAPRSEKRDPADGAPADPVRTETQSIESSAEPDDVVALLVDLRRVPDWAPAFADTVVGDARAGWRASKDGREFAVRVAVNKDAGTVDYLREVSPGREGGAYLRAVPRPGGGTVIVMTLPLLPDVDPADVAATLTAELSALAELLTRSS